MSSQKDLEIVFCDLQWFSDLCHFFYKTSDFSDNFHPELIFETMAAHPGAYPNNPNVFTVQPQPYGQQGQQPIYV